MINSTILAGRLVKDMETRQSNGGTTIGRFVLAIDRPKYKGEDKGADFPDCTLLGKRAEGLAPYLVKGKPIAVRARAQTRMWKDKNDVTHKTTEFLVEDVMFLPDGKGKGSGGKLENPAAEFGGQDINFDPDDVPF